MGTTRETSAQRRLEARDLMSRLGRSSSVERMLSNKWGLGRRQVRKIMTAALKEMAKDQVQTPENYAALEAMAWENATKAAAAGDHRAVNAYLRTLVHLEANRRPDGDNSPRSIDARRRRLQKRLQATGADRRTRGEE